MSNRDSMEGIVGLDNLYIFGHRAMKLLKPMSLSFTIALCLVLVAVTSTTVFKAYPLGEDYF